MNIDFHAHVYPEDYLKRLEASTGDVRIETDNKGEKWILSMGAKAARSRRISSTSTYGSTESLKLASTCKFYRRPIRAWIVSHRKKAPT